jgi:SAM-dependent methyltransferase
VENQQPSAQNAQNRKRARELSEAAVRSGDYVGWFEKLYREAQDGVSIVPWADGEPNPHLVEWARGKGFGAAAAAAAAADTAESPRALVVGCGLGDDAEYVAGLGFRVTAFDISATAIDAARRRFPDSAVDYVAADLLAPPAAWTGAFDLVAEIYTVQPLYGPARAQAISVLPRLVGPGGTLLAVARATEEAEPERDPATMPWPLTRAEIDALAGDALTPVDVRTFHDGEATPVLRWIAEFRR